MNHPSTRQVYTHWNERRGSRPAPERAEIDPGAIRRVLADTFLLGFDAAAGHPFRLAGTRVCAAFSRELKREAFIGLWRPQDRALMHELLARVADASAGFVANATSANREGCELAFELLVLPLRHQGRTDARVLGSLAPVEMPYWFGVSPIGPLTLGSHRHLDNVGGEQICARLATRALPRRVSRDFVVYDGGRP